jgi:hypothetical protein
LVERIRRYVGPEYVKTSMCLDALEGAMWTCLAHGACVDQVSNPIPCAPLLGIPLSTSLICLFILYYYVFMPMYYQPTMYIFCN